MAIAQANSTITSGPTFSVWVVRDFVACFSVPVSELLSARCL